MSHRRLARAAAAPEQADASARAVFGNVRAMERAIEIGSAARTVTVARILELHRELFRDTPDAARAGRLRETQNWLGGREDSPFGAEFIPPPEDRVGGLLRDLWSRKREWPMRNSKPSILSLTATAGSDGV